MIELLQSMVGDRPGVTMDSLISSTTCMAGAFYYLPAVAEFGMAGPGSIPMSDLLFDHWDVKPDNNKYMFYNHKEYMSRMSNALRENASGQDNPENDPYDDPPSQRVLHLVKAMFENWEDTWFHERRADPIPHLFDVSTDLNIKNYSMHLRQAHAVRLTLSQVYTTGDFSKLEESYGVVNDLFRIHPYDLLAGKMPVYGLGVGQIAMPYLEKDPENGGLSSENVKAYFHKLSEVSGFGHVVPNYQTLLSFGVPGFIRHLKSLHIKETDIAKKEYYDCCVLVFTGVQEYMLNYSALASHLASRGAEQNVDYNLTAININNLQGIATRMSYLANGDKSSRNTNEINGIPRNFHEAVQLLLTLHACMHMTSEPVSIGRLDTMLEPFLIAEYSQYTADPQAYQDIVDAFWIKIGEKVQLSRETRLDLYAVGAIAVPYRSDGRFARGDGCNQWVQQVTVGGYTHNGSKLVPPSSQRTEIIKMCLKAARRLPLNAPCVSLRMHKGVDENVIQEATKSILSGG